MKLTLTPSKKTNSSTAADIDSSSTSDSDVRIHEGSSYQANIPALDPTPSPTDHEAIPFWQPNDSISDNDLIEYIDFARRKHRMSEEQALAVLQICKYRISTSKLLMQQYTPEIDEWTVEEKCLFEQAYKFYGKIFSRIRQMLPDKSVGDLVRYYYSWKKTRLHKSLMDKHEKQSQLMPYDDDEEDSDDEERNTTSIPLPTKDLDHRGKMVTDQTGLDEQECCNCEVTNVKDSIGPMHSTPKGILCNECFIYWQNSGLMRPELFPSKSSIKKIKRPPKNMAVDLNSILAVNSYDNNPTSNTDNNEIIDPIDKLEEEIRQELAVVQAHNQTIDQLTNQCRDGMETMRIPFLTSSSSPFMINNSNSITVTPTSNWTTEEILLAIQAFGKYGKDFDAVARIIGPTKAIADVESFFLECRERYQLDMVIEMHSKPVTSVQRKQPSTANNDLNSNRSNTNDIVLC
ncbi:unnamed protein product [Rotaria socialis]|uniref:REST corepressor n=1 Tax=Rotaria socialis TaxID=392032 RepID=A0A817S119_9BILA|nr:unnamed protein product [Rotaria socialis]CAF3385019.1 unnamed protein product [Rotaria socialis]CAF3409066.1 unnamed protein product [Rotaria socialis]CAF3476411.1 unnamed protein product [Rotaria socialis]CAF3592115.1 unnamed protein product [Rotaria socialis]